jgi:hypothetical protein
VATSSRVVNSARPHHVDGSRVTTWPEKMIYSRISTVGLDPHGKVPNPYMYGPNLWVRSRTSTGVPGPLGRVLDPPYAGSKPLTARSRDPGTKNTQTLIKVRRGSEADTCPDHNTCASTPRSGGFPMLPHGRLPMM